MARIFRGTGEDVDRAMTFIGEYWKMGHILAVSKEFFEWQYCVDGDYTYYLAEDERGEVCGFYGVILYNSTSNPDVAGNMWKVKKSDNPILGVELARFAREDLNFRSNGTLGLNKRARKIEQLQGRKPRKMAHYYRLNKDMDYVVAEVVKKEIKPVAEMGTQLLSIKYFDEFADFVCEEMLQKKRPYKDKAYYKRRFFEHPVYLYNCYAIQIGESEPRSFLFTRMIDCKGSRVMKIVDFVGEDEDLQYIGYSFDELLKKESCEYGDFYCLGIEKEILEKAGFCQLDEMDPNIIPHYFEPYEKSNIDIYTGHIQEETYHMYISNSDQDRPSSL